jgi:hypothetical protein
MALAGKAEPLLIDLKNPKQPAGAPSAMTNQEICGRAGHDSLTSKKVRLRRNHQALFVFDGLSRVRLHRRAAGAQLAPRDTSGGWILSLLIGTGYFLVTMLAEQFKTDAGAAAVLWAPNVAACC